ncbi:GTP-binding protein [Virgibacillus salexigens]|uniref:CobW C-terminal domain-containing protein n=1 Tax=Virgibacillus kapii TaxID=1638645 RepID=A0ABQ2DHF1_9BACI|nr:GTP-binding protein [Virgibacillus kapii]GGJ57854.1 hypothetical protein GCM10007111_19890 [Virgibacillus kapii]
MNPTATKYVCLNSQIDLRNVLNIYSFDLNEKLRLNANGINAKDHHDESISSLLLKETRPLDLRKLNLWFSYLVQIQGENLYRYLNIEGKDKRYIFQGVHMLFAGEEKGNWREEDTRISELVFIGKNLNKEKLTRQFRRCISEKIFKSKP